MNTRLLPLLATLCDGALCLAALAAGATPRTAQAAGFVASVALQLRWAVLQPPWAPVRAAPASGGPARRVGLAAVFGLATLAVYFVRDGLLALRMPAADWPNWAALGAAVAVTALGLRMAYALCIDLAGRGGDWPWRSLAAAVLAYAFALRLVFAAGVDLLPEETYYWSYSKHLDFGYLDHPPLVAWLIRAGTALCGDTEFGVRMGALVCGLIASRYVFRLTRNVFDEAAAWAAVLLLQLLPFFFMAGLLMTPDAPLAAAWAAALYYLERALVGGRTRAWLGTGIAFGVGLLAKYTIVLLAAGALLFMLLDPSARRQLRRPGPWLALGVAAVLFSPTVAWNAAHHWASFAFQTSHRLADHPQFALFKLLGSVLILITPTGCLAVVLAARRRRTADPGRRLIDCCLWVPLGVFAVFSLRREVKLDWTGAPWSAAMPVIAADVVRRLRRGATGQAFFRVAWPATLVVLALVYGAGLDHLTSGLPGLGYSAHTELIPAGWREFGADVGELARRVAAPGEPLLVVGMDRYAIAGETAFYAPNQRLGVARSTAAHLLGGVGLMYEQWFPAERQAGRTLLLVAWDPRDLATSRLEPYARRLGDLREGVIQLAGRPLRPYYYRLLWGYRPPPPAG